MKWMVDFIDEAGALLILSDMVENTADTIIIVIQHAR